MDVFVSITDKVREMCIKNFGFQEDDSGLYTKKLTTEDDFSAIPLLIMYGFFRDAFENQTTAYYYHLKEAYYTFRISPAIDKIPFTKEEKDWLEEVNSDDELYHWNHLMDWLREEMLLLVDEKAANEYYGKLEKEWEQDE